MSDRKTWEFWIDRGGTFTDCIGLAPDGRVVVEKVLSSDRAPLTAIRGVLGLARDAAIPPCRIRMGTTVATNALLTRTGTKTALAITRGFADALAIGTQARPELFNLNIEKPENLYGQVAEIDARMAADGQVLDAPDRAAIKAALGPLREAGYEALAVVLLHGFAHPQHEVQVGEIAREMGFSQVSLSHQVAPEIGFTARGDTTCVDAYLSPLIRDYVATLRAELPKSDLAIMQSSGGLTDAANFRGHNAILSGPAGGVVAAAHVAEACGFEKGVGFDMGGTSTDVCRFAGEFERVYETVTAGVRVKAPMLAIHTVAAGGGSLCRYDGFQLRVGPESAGADPGPLCYGLRDEQGNMKATELTVTDINLALGRVLPDRFPFPLDAGRVTQKLSDLAEQISRDGTKMTPEKLADGFLSIANAGMAQAIKEISIARGVDVRDYPLVVFGGAGGQHACAIARRLGIGTILLHPMAGVLSALGMGLAPVAWNGDAPGGGVMLAAATGVIVPLFKKLAAAGEKAVRAQGHTGDIVLTRRLDLRYQGTEAPLTVTEPCAGAAPADWEEAFTREHMARFGHDRPGCPIEVVQVRVEATGTRPAPDLPTPAACEDAPPVAENPVWFDGERHEGVPVYPRETLAVGTQITGPALIPEATGMVVVAPGFSANVNPDGVLVLTDHGGAAAHAHGAEADPVHLEIFNNLFMSIAGQMGIVLKNAAVSTNIKERLDFSCAVFDANGGLVANAPHIPVHLGAMGETVKAVRAAHPNMAAGDVFISNDPALGGSHLPDITVVTPVFIDGAVRFFTASRGHHADVGGITPGSMPPFSTKLAEEGIVFSAERLIEGGRFLEEDIRVRLAAGPYPARGPDDNVSDLKAQAAAGRKGEKLLVEMAQQYGLDTVTAYMGHVQENARAQVAAAIGRLPDGAHAFADQMDDGTPIAVTLKVTGARMVIDFTGTGDQVESNLNAPTAVTKSAVIYVLRTLVNERIPLNSGCLLPVEIVLPEGSILNPAPDCAVAAGNVETSTRVVDVLLAAVGRAAASQGTMNNLTFGDGHFGYYETIAGGAGAVAPWGEEEGHHGASGVHTHMTNTRITDPEVLETRYPVQVVSFGFRENSGGRGKWHGGDGLVRHLRFLAPLSVSLLCERRTVCPFGLDGGNEGAPGNNIWLKPNGGLRQLPGKVSFDVEKGDELVIETPGGGGWGDNPGR